MKKFWLVYPLINAGPLKQFETIEAARDEAKRITKDNPVFVLEAVEVTQVPVPAIEITKL